MTPTDNRFERDEADGFRRVPIIYIDGLEATIERLEGLLRYLENRTRGYDPGTVEHEIHGRIVAELAPTEERPPCECGHSFGDHLAGGPGCWECACAVYRPIEER